MKKICLTLIAVFSAFQFTYAQWTTSGNNINNTNTGNVLITGTAYSTGATTGALQVAGGIGASGYSTFNKGIEISGAWNPSGVNYVFGTMINAFNADANAVTGIYGLGVNLSTFAASYTTSQVGILALSPINKGAGHTITTATGISMGNTTAATNNTNFLIGSLIPTGNYSIYNQSTYQNYFAGSLGLLTAAPTHTLTLGSTSNGVAAYNTADQVTNYERAVQYWNANTYTFATQAAGTGAVRNFAFTGGNMGIGTATPVTALDAVGNLTLENNANVPNAGATLHFTSLNTQYPGPTIKSSLVTAGPNVFNNLVLSSYWNGYKNELTLQNGTVEVNGGLTVGSYAATNTPPTNGIIVSGNVGIGTITPQANLSVNGSFLSSGTNCNLDPSGGANSLSFLNGTGQMLIGWNRTSGEGETDFIGNPGSGASGGFAFYNHPSTGEEKQLMYIQGNGSVLIGTPPPTSSTYLLNVAGTERANQIVVNTTGADFVFEPAYKLSSLSAVKKYIEQNHHLPEIPSAKQMQTDGLNVGDNQIKLLQKVEELTLYTIASDKQMKNEQSIIAQQQALLLQLQNQLKAEQKEIDQLKNNNHQ